MAVITAYLPRANEWIARSRAQYGLPAEGSPARERISGDDLENVRLNERTVDETRRTHLRGLHDQGKQRGAACQEGWWIIYAALIKLDALGWFVPHRAAS